MCWAKRDDSSATHDLTDSEIKRKSTKHQDQAYSESKLTVIYLLCTVYIQYGWVRNRTAVVFLITDQSRYPIYCITLDRDHVIKLYLIKHFYDSCKYLTFIVLSLLPFTSLSLCPFTMMIMSFYALGYWDESPELWANNSNISLTIGLGGKTFHGLLAASHKNT